VVGLEARGGTRVRRFDRKPRLRMGAGLLVHAVETSGTILSDLLIQQIWVCPAMI
jgi:hypothetical protein